MENGPSRIQPLVRCPSDASSPWLCRDVLAQFMSAEPLGRRYLPATLMGSTGGRLNVTNRVSSRTPPVPTLTHLRKCAAPHFRIRSAPARLRKVAPSDVRGMVQRPLRIDVEVSELDGRRRLWVFERGIARLVLHEIDHLVGRLYADELVPDTELLPLEEYRETRAGWKY